MTDSAGVAIRPFGVMARSLFALALAGTIVSCANDETVEPVPWGTEATRFFDGLSTEYAENDFYGILDYYESTTFVERWRGDLRGGALIPDLLKWDANGLRHRVDAVYLSSSGAISLIEWSENGQASALLRTVDAGRISVEVVFELIDSLQRSLRASPQVMAPYHDLYREYAEAWSVGDEADIAALYADDAAVTDSLAGLSSGSTDEIVTDASPGSLATVDLGEDVESTGIDGLYLGPADYSTDPARAIGVYSSTDDAGCTHRIAVAWTLDQGRIVTENRYHEIQSFRACREDPPQGWWTDWDSSEPSDQVATGVIRTPGGQEIEVRNGTPVLESILLEGMKRFQVAGLKEPEVTAVTFQPTRECVDRSGRVIQTSGTRVLYICLFESDVCPAQPECDEPRLSIRVTVAHELSHAWMMDHVDDETENRLLDLTGQDVWYQESVPWAEQGVEYAADAMAWGLLPSPPRMARIGNPPCQELTEAFRILTGILPVHDVDAC